MKRPTTSATHNVLRQRSIFDDTVASRIEALLARCDQLRLARDIDRPTTFNAAGERHARSVAERDEAMAAAPLPGGIGLKDERLEITATASFSSASPPFNQES